MKTTRIRQWQDDRPLGMFRHLSHDLFGKRARLCRASNKNRRLHALHNLKQPDLPIIVRLRVCPLLVWPNKLAHRLPDLGCPQALMDEPELVDEEKVLVGLGRIQSVYGRNAVTELSRDAQPGGPSTIYDEALVRELRLRDPDCRHDACEGHRAGTLARRPSHQ